MIVGCLLRGRSGAELGCFVCYYRCLRDDSEHVQAVL
jgi:hypothetical protein